jgi:hypothetical protein
VILTSVSPFALVPVARQFGTASRATFTAAAQPAPQPTDSVHFSARKRKPGVFELLRNRELGLPVSGKRIQKNALSNLSQHLKSGRALNAEAQKQYFRDFARAARVFGMTELLTKNGKDVVSDVKSNATPYLSVATTPEERLKRALKSLGQSGNLYAAKLLDALALVEAGANVNTVTTSGTPLQGAALHRFNTDIIMLLLARGADVNKIGVNPNDERLDKLAPLQMASLQGHTDIVRLLLAKGADVNLVDATRVRTTALHMAAANGYTNIVKLLLAYGADLHAVDYMGETALHYAKKERHASMIALLEQAEWVQSRKRKAAATDSASLSKGRRLS